MRLVAAPVAVLLVLGVLACRPGPAPAPSPAITPVVVRTPAPSPSATAVAGAAPERLTPIPPDLIVDEFTPVPTPEPPPARERHLSEIAGAASGYVQVSGIVSGSKVVIRGTAASLSRVADFMLVLQRDGYGAVVDLQETTDEGGQVRFAVSLTPRPGERWTPSEY